MAKSLLDGNHLIFWIVNKNELQIAVDVSHEPWTIVAAKILKLIKDEMVELGYEIEDLDETIKLLADDERRMHWAPPMKNGGCFL